jgi:phospholipid/cholesterol/gamma-HCH transport system substrate-binding protein
MRTAIQKHRRDFIAIVVMIVLATIPGAIILSNQRFYLPAWVPLIGTDFFELKAEFATAQSLTPGQGQTVNIAGVPVGEIRRVELEGGRAVVTMVVRRKYAKMIHTDATMLTRPKTGLNDMIIQLDPGTKSAPTVSQGYRFPVGQTAPNVNLDEFLAGLDRDTRDYLRLLLNGAGEGFRHNGKAASATLKRFAPLNRDIAKASRLVAQRRQNVKRAIHNFQLLLNAIGAKDKQLTQLIDSSNAVFERFAAQDANLQKTLELLPGALEETNTALIKSDKLNAELGPTLRKLNPGIKGLDRALPQVRRFARQTTPVIKNQIRPFTRQATPAVRDLKPAARDLHASTPRLRTTFEVINNVLNAFAHNPKGEDEGFIFWALWAGHVGRSVFAMQDAHSTATNSVILADCVTIQAVRNLGLANIWAGLLIDLVNLPDPAKCAGK